MQNKKPHSTVKLQSQQQHLSCENKLQSKQNLEFPETPQYGET